MYQKVLRENLKKLRKFKRFRQRNSYHLLLKLMKTFSLKMVIYFNEEEPQVSQVKQIKENTLDVEASVSRKAGESIQKNLTNNKENGQTEVIEEKEGWAIQVESEPQKNDNTHLEETRIESDPMEPAPII